LKQNSYLIGKKTGTLGGGADLLGQYENFFKFYNKVVNLPYFSYKADQGSLIAAEEWYRRCENFSVSGVFEALARHDAKADKDMIWGDKSPSYIRHVPLIKKLFPEAKIIHIIRDVRDYCLSINKAWGKNMLRAAQRWADDVTKAKKDAENFKEDYFELRYEDLLEAPNDQLKKLCSFLSIKYEPRMLILENPTENIGDAKGSLSIVQQNSRKYITRISGSKILKIEKISSRVLENCGYRLDLAEAGVKEERMNPIFMTFFQIVDGINLFKYSIKKRSVGSSLSFLSKYFISSGNRRINK